MFRRTPILRGKTLWRQVTLLWGKMQMGAGMLLGLGRTKCRRNDVFQGTTGPGGIDSLVLVL